jgi:hypothetical protein
LATLAWLVAGAAPARADGNTNQNDTAPPLPVPTARSMAIEVISANYGHSGTFNNCVVTPSVKRSCNGRNRCSVKVADQLCEPPNALPTELIMTLTVVYKCMPDVIVHIAKADKPFRLVVDCGANSR